MEVIFFLLGVLFNAVFVLSPVQQWLNERIEFRRPSQFFRYFVFIASGIGLAATVWWRYHQEGFFAAGWSLSALLGMSTVWFGIELLNYFKTCELNQWKAMRTLEYVFYLHRTAFTAHNRHLRRFISVAGHERLHEELTIVSLEKPIHFYECKYGVAFNSSFDDISVTARNAANDVPLPVRDLSKNRDSREVAVILNVASTKDSPVRLRIDCQRTRIWDRLVREGEDEGFTEVPVETDLLTLEFIAPEGFLLTGIRRTPEVGNTTIDYFEGRSRLSWVIDKPVVHTKFYYQLFIQKRTMLT